MATDSMPSPAEMLEQIRDQWYKTVSELFFALKQTFPECTQTAMLHSIIEGAKGNNSFIDRYLKEWHEAMSAKYGTQTGYECVQRRDLAPLAQIGILSRMNFMEKWADPSFTPDDREVLIDYITILNDCAKGYGGISAISDVIPDKMLGVLASKMGNIDPRSMDMSQAMNIAGDITQSLSQEEMEKMMETLPQMMSQMGSLVGEMPPEMQGMMMGAGAGPEGLMGMLGGMGGGMGGMDLQAMLSGAGMPSVEEVDDDDEVSSASSKSPTNK